MATLVQGSASSLATAGQASFGNEALGADATVGNLLVAYYGARDDGDNATPAFSVPGDWTKVAETSPMEFHSAGIAFKTAEGGERGLTVSFGASCNSVWCGVAEFNQAGVSSWQLDKAASNGSGATSVSNIASGSTGVLASAIGVAAIVGTSRTGTENLSTNVGTSLSGTDADFEKDAGAANFIAAWLNLTATDALNATITEAVGASRMGAGIAVFIEAGNGAQPIAVGAVTETESASAASVVSGSAQIIPAHYVGRV